MAHGSKHRCMEDSEARVFSDGARCHGPIRNVQVIETQTIRQDRLKASERLLEEGYR
jgi:hypothetical protein